MRKPRSVLVLGHTGFIGGGICEHIRRTYPAARLAGISRRARKRRGLDAFSCDLNDTRRLSALIRKRRPDWIFHAAGRTSEKNSAALFEIHPVSTASLFDAVENLPGRKPRIVLSGSAAEYGILSRRRLPVRETAPSRPVSPYGAAKAAQTELGRVYARRNLDVVIGRMFNVLGPGLDPHLALSSFVDQVVRIERGGRRPVLEVGDLSPKRDFVDIVDAADAMTRLASIGRPGEIYNICSGRSVSMRSLVNELLRLSHKKIRLRIDKARVRKIDIPDMRGSTRKMARETGWKSRITPVESLRAMLEERRRRE